MLYVVYYLERIHIIYFAAWLLPACCLVAACLLAGGWLLVCSLLTGYSLGDGLFVKFLG